MKKNIKKFFSILVATIFIFGAVSFYLNFVAELKVRAQGDCKTEDLNFKTDGSYKWAIEGGNLTNYVDVYCKSNNEKITTLKVYYKNNGNGTLSSYSSPSDPRMQPAVSKIGEYTIYSLASTSDNKFTVPDDYKGKYHFLAKSNTTELYSEVFYTSAYSLGFIGYLFETSGGSKTFLQVSNPKTNNWYGIYLTDTSAAIQAGGNPVTPPSSTNEPGTGTGECQLEANCKPKTPVTPGWVSNSGNIPTVSETLKQSNIATAWALSLDVVNVIAIFVLLAIAFANILHIDPEAWNFKRLIPALVIGLIAANFSHLICRAIIDFAGMLMNFFVPKEKAVDVAANIYTGMFGGWTGATGGGFVMFGAGAVAIVAFFMGQPLISCGIILIGLIILGFPVIITLILWFILMARTYLLWLLVILSPIAFFGMFIDPFKKMIGMWWKYFLEWTFLGPIAYFFIYLAEGFARDTSGTNAIGGCFDPSNADQVGGFVKYLAVNALLVLAIIVPYLMGGKIMGYWGQFGKFLGKAGFTGASLGATGAGKLAGKGYSALGAKLEKRGGSIGKLGEGMKKAGKAWQDRFVPPHLLIPAAQQLYKDVTEANAGVAAKNMRKNIMSLPGGKGIFSNWLTDAANKIDRSKDNIWQRALYDKKFEDAAPHVLAAGLRDVGKRGPQTVEEKRALGAILQVVNSRTGALDRVRQRENALAIARSSSGASSAMIKKREEEYEDAKKGLVSMEDIYHGTDGSADHARERLKKKGGDADEIMSHLGSTLDDDAKRAIEAGDWAHFSDTKYANTGLDTLAPGGAAGAGGVQREIDENLSQIPTQRVTP